VPEGAKNLQTRVEAEVAPGQKVALFVRRRAVDGTRTLRELVAENVALNEARLVGYTVLADAEAPVGGLPGVLLQTRWRLGAEVFHQRQAHVVVGGTHMVFAVSGPLDEWAACDEAFASLLETLTWRADREPR
jgi:hypothetical protein